jgi:hypothetical protein
MSHKSSKTLNFPTWVPQDAREAVTSLYDSVHSDRECRYMLQRIATRDSMKDAWEYLKRFGEYSPSELVLLTTVTWLSARRFPSLGKSASEPIPVQESEKASLLRAVADEVRVLDPVFRAAYKITEVTQQELERVAAYFEQQADRVLFLVGFAASPRKKGAQNAGQVAFVNHLCGLLWSRMRPRRRPYSLVAILTNVAFNVREGGEWDADRVKHCYHSRSPGK